MNRSWLVMVVALFALAAGAGVAAWRGSRGGNAAAPWRHVVAIDGTHALVYAGGIAAPFELRAVERNGANLAERWRWNGGGNLSAHPWAWTQHGNFLAGEFHRPQGQGETRVIAFDAVRGRVAEVINTERGSFALVDDHTLMTVTGRQIHLVDLSQSPASEWVSPLAQGRFATYVGATPSHAVIWNGTLQIFDRAHAWPGRGVDNVTDLVGLASQRDEVLVLREGRIGVVSLADGTERMPLDLAQGQPIADGLAQPCLLGEHNGRWLVLYTLTLDAIHIDGSRSWTAPAPAFLAAIDPASGQVAWRAAIGGWDYHCRDEAFRNAIPTDDALSSPLLLHALANQPDGSSDRGHLIALDLESGATQWEATYDNAGRGGNFWVRRGAVVYARLGSVNRDAVVRFDGARLTGAVRFSETTDTLAAPATAPDAAWLGGERWAALVAPDLHVIPLGNGAPRVTPSLAWAATRFALPPAAR